MTVKNKIKSLSNKLLKDFFFLGVFISTFASSEKMYCQENSPIVDSLKGYLNVRPTLTGDLGSMHSFFYGFKAPIWYASAGINFANRLEFGGGYARLYYPDVPFEEKEQLPFYKYFLETNNLGNAVLFPGKLKYEYLFVYGKYVFYKSNRWKFSVPLRLGIGKTEYKLWTHESGVFKQRMFFANYNPSVSISYAITKWFGVSSNLGFLISVHPQRTIRSRFSSYVVNGGLYISYSELYRYFVKRKK